MNISLADFDNRLMNGLNFCKKAYLLFEQIRKSPDGVERLRLRNDHTVKILIEELIPISRYIQARYSHGRQIKARWKDGSQSYDAHLYFGGVLVDKHQSLKSQYVEVTTAVHDNDHIARRLLNEKGYVYGVKGIRIDPQTGERTSEPYVYNGDEPSQDLSGKILERIEAKANKSYPADTILIIQCFLDTSFGEDEWEYAIQKVRDDVIEHPFHEIFIFDPNHHYSSMLHRKRNTSDSFDTGGMRET